MVISLLLYLGFLCNELRYFCMDVWGDIGSLCESIECFEFLLFLVFLLPNRIY